MNALLHHVPGIDQLPRAGIVHRLDKDTSGLMVVAKTLEAQTDLVRQLQARTVRRVYLALAAGVIKKGGGVETGRTHQIRVHMASINHPLVGDPVYGKTNPKLPEFPRQALHATRLGLVHPLTGMKMQWEVPMPEDMRNLLDTLRYGG
jgi:23S rRNA pseudouridine1911/1915/1917 synthase